MLVKPQDAVPHCEATVELLSKVMRPFLFSVKVVGKPPHEYTRVYNIRANSDSSAAFKGIELFVTEFTNNPAIKEMETLAPGAKLI